MKQDLDFGSGDYDEPLGRSQISLKNTECIDKNPGSASARLTVLWTRTTPSSPSLVYSPSPTFLSFKHSQRTTYEPLSANHSDALEKELFLAP